MSVATIQTAPDINARADRFAQKLAAEGIVLRRSKPRVLQLNVGRLCNQTCRHCHVNAGPTRKELMSREVAVEAVSLLDRFPSIDTLDITGGAPEMAPCFRWLAGEGRRRGLRVIDRCNLTILTEPGYEDLSEFLASQRVEIVASLPCYSEENVDRQRGEGVFARSIEGLRMLNGLGYGLAQGGENPQTLRLTLVFNPGGPSLPPPQGPLEADYRRRLAEEFGIVFDRLIALANLPIGRFQSDLRRSGRLDEYQAVLESAFNPETVPRLMCGDHLSVDYEGYVYDCDFNQMLGIGLGGRRTKIAELTPGHLEEASIATASHCFGCTAGQGSSCAGSLSG